MSEQDINEEINQTLENLSSLNIDDAELYLRQDEDDEDYKKGYKLYNFRRPDKFSKDHLRGLQDIHREFSRQLSMALTAYLRMHLEVNVVSVDQLTYDEFTRSMPTPITIGVFELSPLPGQALIGISFEVLSSIVDRMLGGVGISENNNRELTDIEESLAKKVVERTVKTLESAWKHIMPVQGNVVDLDNNYTLVQVATPGEIVALITLEVQIDNKHFGLISLCFPYPILENILPQLTTQHIYQTKGLSATSEERQQMINKLNTSTVDIKVILGDTDATLQDLIDLKIGDVIKLNNKATDNLIMEINDNKKFFVRPGTLKNKVCVKITDRYNETDDILKAYI